MNPTSTAMNAGTPGRLTVYAIAACPFSQRLEIQLTLKERRAGVDFHTIDITQKRPDWLLGKTRGRTMLPVLETEDGRILWESLVIMHYLEERFPEPAMMAGDPYGRAVEGMLVAFERQFSAAGYRYVLNRDPARRVAHRAEMLAQYALLDDFLRAHSPDGTWLLGKFGFAEAVFTPLFMRFWFLDYYEGFDLPASPEFERVRCWRDACLAHPSARQVSREQIVKLYYDYAQGAGNGALPAGREVSSFALSPSWEARPWPPRDKFGPAASDRDLGLGGA
jgi:glutathione S-transferase